MKNLKMVKIICLIVILATILSGNVFAANESDTTVILPNSISNNTSTTTNTPVTNNTANTSNVVAPTNITSATNNTTNNASSYNTTNLPKTGLEDFTTVFILIAVCVVSAGYAYKKVNDYKNVK